MSYPQIRRSPEANVAYLALKEINEGEVATSIPMENEKGETLLVVDFSSENQVLGIEFLDASTQLPVTAED